MREIWMMQPRFEKRVGPSAFGLVDQPRFRAAFDFMRLRADVGEVEEVLADWWQEFSMANDNLRADMVEQQRLEQGKRSRAPRAPRPQAADGDQASARDSDDAAPPSGEMADGAQADATAPRKRRRRRKPAGGRATGDAGGAAQGGSET
jgi:poly(A) polymerase